MPLAHPYERQEVRLAELAELAPGQMLCLLVEEVPELEPFDEDEIDDLPILNPEQ